MNMSGLLLKSTAAGTWPSSWLRARNSKLRSRCRQPAAEVLEGRIARSGTWTPLQNLMPAGGSASAEMELLSDGQVMIQGGDASIAGTLNWWLLTPDRFGNYADGTWSKVANPAHLQKLYGNSVTLQTGDVMVLGGEYSGPKLAKNWTTETELFDASPWLGSPAYFFEFNPTAGHGRGKITAINPPALNSAPAQSLNIEAQSTSMLVLPNGQVLYDLENSPQLWLYTPSGSPNASWKPTITSVTKIRGLMYHLTGKQLNGMSEGAAPGDDVSMSTNYPIVRLTTAGGFVYYARTFDWSNTEVQTGNTTVTTQFTLPSGIPHGTYNLQVIASGIPSKTFKFKV